MKQIHKGVYGPYMNGHMLIKKIIQQGYYWTTLDRDYYEYVKKCQKCQIHTNLMYTPSSQLYSMPTPQLFSVQGIDIIGEIIPKASNEHRYIIVAIDYFTKQVKTSSYATLKAKDVMSLKKNIICKYGILCEFIFNHDSHFQGEVILLLKIV